MEKNNYKKKDAGCDIYGKQRLELALYLKNNILPYIKNEWFIENGTLLGAWRNGKFIKHDDDFDIGILLNSKEDINHLYSTINNKLLNSKYKARLIDTYSSKIEIFDESYGKYILIADKYNSSDFHYVTLDLQFYIKNENGCYQKLYYISHVNKIFNKDILLPTNTIKLENEIFNAPNNIELFLKQIYGSIDINASYNSKTGLYEI
tara:strand:- start:660 stop:1277 length:618 start_codon:yes stop_codon:yes gene_type:complete